MNNKEYIRGAFDEIHAPDALFGKVMDMNKKESKMRNVLKYVTRAAAALALTFVASNGICYAATGETWVSKAIVYVNGEQQEADVTWYTEGDTLYGEVEVDAGTETFAIENADGMEIAEEVYIEFAEDYASDEGIYGEYILTSSLEEKDGKIYLDAGDESIDITEDFSDGEATGTFDYEGITISYTVTGDVGEYNIELLTNTVTGDVEETDIKFETE